VDDGVHSPDLVDLVCKRARLRSAGKVADRYTRRERRQIGQCRSTLPGACMQNDLMTVVDQRSRRVAAQTICGTGDEYTHATILSLRQRREK
jgi:hypothetical protein